MNNSGFSVEVSTSQIHIFQQKCKHTINGQTFKKKFVHIKNEQNWDSFNYLNDCLHVLSDKFIFKNLSDTKQLHVMPTPTENNNFRNS